MEISDLAVHVLKRVPKNAFSRAFGVVSDVEFPPAAQQVINRSFASLTGVDVAEAEAEPEAYETLNAYFTRRLRDGVRDVEVDQQEAVVSPVDGTVGICGTIEEGTMFQAKGRSYRLLDLVDSAREAAAFDGGCYATLYLAPRDYHRIHTPVGGRVDRVSYIPGHLFPVNPFGVANIDELFAVNERLITYLETPKLGRIGVVKVGATCVGRISLSFEPFETNGNFRRRREFHPTDDIELDHGQELAVFNLGSTVILLVEHPDFEFGDDITQGRACRVGQCLGGIG